MMKPGSTKMMEEKRAGGGSHRLHDVVLLGGVLPSQAQQRHGEDYRRDGGRESEPGLQSEVDVCGGKPR